jgi:3-hydroxyacyl-[acyl-carrier-protein] dehydratase
LTLDSEQIRRILPHRYPFLLVDRLDELEPGVSAVGRKNVTANEQFFSGHWPHRQVMPAVLIVESMAQVSGTMLVGSRGLRGKNAYFVGINKARFRKSVVPGDALIIRVRCGKSKGTFGYCDATAEVDGQVVCEAELMFALAEEEMETGA